MKMRVLFSFPPPKNQPTAVGDADWYMIVRHTWWIFAWDKTYRHRRLACTTKSCTLWQWQDENEKVPSREVIQFLNDQVEASRLVGRAS
jgi:hypothetical protein